MIKNVKEKTIKKIIQYLIENFFIKKCIQTNFHCKRNLLKNNIIMKSYKKKTLHRIKFLVSKTCLRVCIFLNFYLIFIFDTIFRMLVVIKSMIFRVILISTNTSNLIYQSYEEFQFEVCQEHLQLNINNNKVSDLCD